MKELALNSDRRMTVAEVAEILGVSAEAIKKHVRELYPSYMLNGMVTYLDEAQVTEIKKRMLPTTSVVGATTDIEMAQKTVEVIRWAMSKIENLEAELTVTKSKAALADRIAAADGLKSLSEVGKINGIGPRKIFDILSRRRIIYRSGQNWVPYQEFVDGNLFVVRESTYEMNGVDHLYSKTYVTGKGELWLAKRLFSEAVQ